MRPGPVYAAYSFVDRIESFDPGRRASATFTVPSGVAAFPSCLVAEAVGQLAAWVAMEHIDFRGRPVAALATETVFHGDAHPGEHLALEVDLLACDDDAVAYNGRASVGDLPIVELIDCLGPMLPVGDFDSPEALRERLAVLRGQGAVPERFRGIPPLPVAVIERHPGTALRARLDVPREAPFFHDHFPRRPVFPATLLLDALLRLALDCAVGSPTFEGAAPQVRRVTHVKMRSFIEPGQVLELATDVAEIAAGDPIRAAGTPAGLKAMLSARTDGRLVATARVEIGAAETRSERAA